MPGSLHVCNYWTVFAQFNHLNSEMRIFAISSPMLEANVSWLTFVTPSLSVRDASVGLLHLASVNVSPTLQLQLQLDTM